MRIDGRNPNQLRPVVIELNPVKYAEGSAIIRMGDTEVLCTATVEDNVPPFLRDSGSGWITAEYSMLPRATRSRNRRDSVRGKIGGRSHEIQRLIGRSLRSIVNMDKLGEQSIIIDCDVIQADGGTRTASITGAFVALKKAILAQLEQEMLDEDPIIDSLAAVSVGIFDDELLLDLNYEEDSKADVDMNIVMTGSGMLVEVQGTAEKSPFTQDQLKELVELGKKGILELIFMQNDCF